jgi:hypothetical protein
VFISSRNAGPSEYEDKKALQNVGNFKYVVMTLKSKYDFGG